MTKHNTKLRKYFIFVSVTYKSAYNHIKWKRLKSFILICECLINLTTHPFLLCTINFSTFFIVAWKSSVFLKNSQPITVTKEVYLVTVAKKKLSPFLINNHLRSRMFLNCVLASHGEIPNQFRGPVILCGPIPKQSWQVYFKKIFNHGSDSWLNLYRNK